MDFEKNTIKAQLTNPEDTMVPLVQIVGDQSENPFITIRDKNVPILSEEEKTMIQNKTYEESFASSVKGEHKTVSQPLIAKDKTPVLVSDLKTVSEVQDKNVSPLLIAKDKTPVLLSDLKTVSEVQDKNVSPVPKSIMKKDTKYDQMEKEKKYELVPPDGGWGWAIMVATALSNLITVPILQSFGLLYRDTFNNLGMSATDSSIIINVNSAFGMILGLFHGVLLNKFGYRKMAVTGALVTFIGLFLTSFGSTFTHFLISYGLISCSVRDLHTSTIIFPRTKLLLQKVTR